MGRSVHTPAYRALLETLIAAREEAGLTQVELAARLGRTQSFISKCERGERRIDLVEFVEFVTAMGEEQRAIFDAFLSRQRTA